MLDRIGWNTACPDWRTRLVERRSLIPDLPLFAGQADRALRVFKRLRVPDLVGTPTYGEVCGAWVFDLVRAIFGAYDPKTRRRMIREFFLLIPKKNGKSSIAAAIMVTAAIVNARPAAELLLIAPTKKIADIAYKQAAGIVRLDPELSKLFHLQTHQRTITHRLTDAAILIKAADADVITGSKATFILIDETHVFAEKANAADIFVEIRGSLASRPDGFLLQITTQSKKPPAGVFRSELNIARDVRDGKLSLPLLPILYELPEELAGDDGWKAEETWPLVNPNIDLSIDRAFLRDELTKAEREGASQLQLIASQHFNVEIGLSLQSDRWAGADFWLEAADDTLSFEEILARCEVVVAGIDGGGLDDLLGFGILGRERDTHRWLHWGKAWVHRTVLELRKSEAQTFRDLEKSGDLVIVDDLGVAREEIAELVARIEDAGVLADKNAIGVDPMGVGLIVDEIVSRDIDSARIVGIPQGWQMNGAIKTAEVKLAERLLVHCGQPIMAYSVGNAKVEPKGNAITITKQAAGKAKIDPFLALLDCVALMSKNPEAAGGRSIYDVLGAQDDDEPAQGDAVDMAILSNPKHPRFMEMRERYEARREREMADEEAFF